MIEIVVSFCLAGNPKVCQDVKMSFMAETVTPHQCMLYGQHEIAKYLESHPRWRVGKWRCGRAGLTAKA